MEKEQLEKLVNRGMSIRSIASTCHTSYSTVRYWLSNFNLKTKVLYSSHETQNSCICSICGRSYNYDRAKGNGNTKCNSCKTNQRKKSIKNRLVETHGGKCCLCGYNKTVEALHFHHKDPSTKKFSIAGSHSRSNAQIIEEVSKCILVCANCHMEIHAGLH